MQFNKIPTLVSDTSLALSEKFNNDVFEKKIIGTLLLDESQYAKIKSSINVEMFSSANLIFAKIIFEILECDEKLTRYNILELAAKNKYSDITSAMIDQYRYCATADDIERTIEMFVYNWYSYQKAINAAYLISDIQSGVDAVIATANFEKRDYEIELIKESNDEQAGNFQDQVEASFQNIMLRRDNPDMLLGISTGFADMDRMIGGFVAGNLYIIGGASGDGKSTLALQIITNALASAPSCFFSLEMTYLQIVPKMMSAMTGISTLDMTTAHITDNDAKALSQAKEELKTLPFSIVDNKFHIEAIKKSIRSKVKREGLKLACIDHLGIVQHSLGKGSFDLIYDEIAYELKRLAKEVNIPIILLAQKNKDSTSRANKRPVTDDLKYGGKVAADIVFFPHRLIDEESGNVFSEETHSEIVITKNRETGLTGALKRIFSKSWNMYCEIDINGNAILPNQTQFPTPSVNTPQNVITGIRGELPEPPTNLPF